MTHSFYLRDEFIQWLTESAKFPILSARSYCSYVSAVDKNLQLDDEDTDTTLPFFEMIKQTVEIGNFIRMGNVIISVINHLSEQGIEARLGKPLSSISKWKSGLYQYREFLYEYIDVNIIGTVPPVATDEDDDDSEYPSEMLDFDFQHHNLDNDTSQFTITLDGEDMHQIDMPLIYKKEDLYKTFRFRLITQNRYYKEIFYPISFIKRLCYKRNERQYFDRWIDQLLDNTTVHYEGGQTILSEINSISITKDDVNMITNKWMKPMYTKRADNLTLAPMIVENLQKIALDHDKPLLSDMRENIDKLPMIMEITAELRKHIRGQVNADKLKVASNIVLATDYIATIDLQKLKSELAVIAQHTRLQLMHGGQNAMKGAIDLL